MKIATVNFNLTTEIKNVKGAKQTGGTNLTKSDEMEWMELFETKKAEAQAQK